MRSSLFPYTTLFRSLRYFISFYYHSSSSEALFSIMNGTHQEQFSASRSKDDPSRLQGVFSSRASEHAGADCEIDYGGSPYSCLGFSRHCGARAECIFIGVRRARRADWPLYVFGSTAVHAAGSAWKRNCAPSWQAQRAAPRQRIANRKRTASTAPSRSRARTTALHRWRGRLLQLRYRAAVGKYWRAY